MAEISLGTASKNRKSAWTPDVRVVNYIVEQSVTNQFNGVDHIQRPGLVPFVSIGTGPIRSVFRQAGTFLGDFLSVSGTQLYRVTDGAVTTLIGAIPGFTAVVTAATASAALMVSDGLAYRTDGITISSVVMPDARPVGSVAQLNGYFVLPQEGSARVYYIPPGQTDPDGLDYFTTESSPGFILKVERVGDELWFFKEEGIEVWVPTGDADMPFQRVPGRNYDKGARTRESIVRFDNSVVWVGNDGLVYRGENTPIRISDNSLEERIRKSTLGSARAWQFAIDGHSLYVLTMTEGTFVYDASSQMWSEFQSYNRPAWRAWLGDMGSDFVLAGDDELGLIYRLDAEVSTDNGVPIERILGGGIALPGGSAECDSLDVYVTTGTTPDPSLYPKVRVRWSDNLRTFNDWRDMSIGRQGQYGLRCRMTRLGRMTYPGRLFEFQITDDCVATISAAATNVPNN